jgi:hypothetical protein
VNGGSTAAGGLGCSAATKSKAGADAVAMWPSAQLSMFGQSASQQDCGAPASASPWQGSAAADRSVAVSAAAAGANPVEATATPWTISSSPRTALSTGRKRFITNDYRPRAGIPQSRGVRQMVPLVRPSAVRTHIPDSSSVAIWRRLCKNLASRRASEPVWGRSLGNRAYAMNDQEAHRRSELHTGLLEILDEAMSADSATRGKIRIFNPQTGGLEIQAQRGFSEEFLDWFGVVKLDEPVACTRAFKLARRVTVKDVATDPLAATFRPVAQAEGFRSLQATPIVGSGGRVVGTLSTHFPRVHHPSKAATLVLDFWSSKAAALIETLLPQLLAPQA